MMNALDGLRASTRAEILVVDEHEMHATIGRAWSRMGRLARLHAIRKAVDTDAVTVQRRAVGANKVLLQGITTTLNQWKNGTPYRLTHVDAGSSGTAESETQTGVITHVDASPTSPRLPITETVVSGKILRTSTFIASSEYVGADLREASLIDSPTGGTAYNRVLFTTPLLNKQSTDTAVMNIDHTLTN